MIKFMAIFLGLGAVDNKLYAGAIIIFVIHGKTPGHLCCKIDLSLKRDLQDNANFLPFREVLGGLKTSSAMMDINNTHDVIPGWPVNDTVFCRQINRDPYPFPLFTAFAHTTLLLDILDILLQYRNLYPLGLEGRDHPAVDVKTDIPVIFLRTP